MKSFAHIAILCNLDIMGLMILAYPRCMDWLRGLRAGRKETSMSIYVWGTGCGASELIEQGLEPERIGAFVDSFPSGNSFLDKPVLLPEELDP